LTDGKACFGGEIVRSAPSPHQALVNVNAGMIQIQDLSMDIIC
jgi:hypothetical protein